MNGKCACLWNDDGEVEIFCGAHMALHQKMIEPLIKDKALLEYIQVYAKNDHPLLSSKPCPLCDWDGVVDDNGMWKGKHIKHCSYHFALNQLYKLKIDGQEDIWDDED